MRHFAWAVVFLLATAIFPKHIHAETSASSAALTHEAPIKKVKDNRVIALEVVLSKYNSPLADYAKTYVDTADKYGIDWKLLPAISGVESTFGKALISGTFNAYGWGSGTIYFKNWEDGIDTIDKSLKNDYMIKWRATDVWSIGKIYAASPTWATRVNHFMEEINAQYAQVSLEDSLRINL
ncbi:MAG: hypothetical protein ACM3IJ_04200 [Candidatus Levyibacteriota bacterium]